MISTRRIHKLPFVWTEGDFTTVSGTCKDLDGTVIDITGNTIEMLYWFKGVQPAKIAGSIVSGVAGTFTAKFSSGIPAHGTLYFIFRLTQGTDIFTSTRVYAVQVDQKFKMVA